MNRAFERPRPPQQEAQPKSPESTVEQSLLDLRNRRINGLEQTIAAGIANGSLPEDWQRKSKMELRKLRRSVNLEAPAAVSWAGEPPKRIENPVAYLMYQSEAVDIAQLWLDGDYQQEKIDTYTQQIDQLAETDPDRAEQIRFDVDTLRGLRTLFDQSVAAFEQATDRWGPSSVLNLIAPLVIGIEHDLRSTETPTNTRVEKSMHALRDIAPQLIDDILSQLGAHRDLNDRVGLCTTFTGQVLKQIMEKPALSEALSDAGIAEIYQVPGGRHHLLLVETHAGDEFYWDPTMEQFIVDDEASGGIGFIGTAEELRNYVKTATREGRLHHDAKDNRLTYENFWNLGGAMDRQRMDFT